MSAARDTALASRRAMLTASGAALLGGGAAVLGLAPEAAPAAPDAALIALCTEFDRLTRHWMALFRGGEAYFCDYFPAIARLLQGYHQSWPGALAEIKDDKEREEAIWPINARRNEILEKITLIQATTIEGLRAKARSVVLHNPDLFDPRISNGIGWDMLAMLTADCAGLGAEVLS